MLFITDEFKPYSTRLPDAKMSIPKLRQSLSWPTDQNLPRFYFTSLQQFRSKQFCFFVLAIRIMLNAFHIVVESAKKPAYLYTFITQMLH